MKYQVGDMLVCNGVLRKEIYLIVKVGYWNYVVWNFQYNCRDSISNRIDESLMWSKL